MLLQNINIKGKQMGIHNRRAFKKQLQSLDHLELEKVYAILAYLISQDLKALPADLTEDDEKIIKEMVALYNPLKLFEHRYRDLPRNVVIRDCDCEKRRCEADRAYSVLEANVLLRIAILDYAVERIDHALENIVLNEGDSTLDPAVEKLKNERGVFAFSSEHLKQVNQGITQYERAQNRNDMIAFTTTVLGCICMIAGVVLAGAAIGLAVAAVNVVPGVGQAADLFAGALIGASIGAYISVFATSVFVGISVLIGLGSNSWSTEKSAKKLAQKTTERINVHGKMLDKNANGLEKAPLKFAQTLSTAGFGFFAKQPKKEKAQKKQPFVQLPKDDVGMGVKGALVAGY